MTNLYSSSTGNFKNMTINTSDSKYGFIINTSEIAYIGKFMRVLISVKTTEQWKTGSFGKITYDSAKILSVSACDYSADSFGIAAFEDKNFNFRLYNIGSGYIGTGSVMTFTALTVSTK